MSHFYHHDPHFSPLVTIPRTSMFQCERFMRYRPGVHGMIRFARQFAFQQGTRLTGIPRRLRLPNQFQTYFGSSSNRPCTG